MLQVSVGRLLYPKYEIFTTRPLFKDKQAFEKLVRWVWLFAFNKEGTTKNLNEVMQCNVM